MIAAIAALAVGVLGLGIAILYEFRRIDAELDKSRLEARRLKAQVDWLMTVVIKEVAR